MPRIIERSLQGRMLRVAYVEHARYEIEWIATDQTGRRAVLSALDERLIEGACLADLMSARQRWNLRLAERRARVAFASGIQSGGRHG